MKWQREKDGRYLVSLERGEDLRSSVEDFAAAQGIVSAKVSAIGAVEDVELGCYELEDQEYIRRRFEGIFELLSMEGNITLLDGAPFWHAHVVLSGHDFTAFGGHLFEGNVGVVCEMFIEPCATPLHRISCPAIGLARWEPEHDGLSDERPKNDQ